MRLIREFELERRYSFNIRVRQVDKRGCELFCGTTPGRKCRNPDSPSEPDQQRGNRLGGTRNGSCHYRTIFQLRNIRRSNDARSRGIAP